MDAPEPFRTRPGGMPLWMKIAIGVLSFFVLMVTTCCFAKFVSFYFCADRAALLQLVIAVIVMGAALKSARDDIKHLKSQQNSSSNQGKVIGEP